ncbi:MAG: YezD family protein [Verrucomicrobiae bacterium]|nr:YezD family protein [Verrucomicrobiae bacterium]
MRTPKTLEATASDGLVRWLETVRQQVASVRFGWVQIVVHDGRVVQIEKTERIRLDPPPGH